MKHIVEPLFVSHCVLVQYCFLSFVSIILCHLCPVHQVRAHQSDSNAGIAMNVMHVIKSTVRIYCSLQFICRA